MDTALEISADECRIKTHRRCTGWTFWPSAGVTGGLPKSSQSLRSIESHASQLIPEVSSILHFVPGDCQLEVVCGQVRPRSKCLHDEPAKGCPRGRVELGSGCVRTGVLARCAV